MKLLIDCHSFDSDFSQGITTYIEGIYKILPSLSWNIDFYFCAFNVNKIKQIFGERNNIHYIKLPDKGRVYRLILLWPNIIKKYKIDVAHFQYVSPLIKNCKTIVTLHDILFIDFPQFFPKSYKLSKAYFFRKSAKQADLLCTVSDYSRERIAYHYNLDPAKICLTPNAVSEDFFNLSHLKGNDKKNPYILYVSRIEPRKNHIAIIEAYQRLELWKLNYTVVFIGRETVPTPILHSYINQLPPLIKEKIIFIPQVNYHELKDWYKNAELFIYPSLAEGFGIPPIEAGAAGVPVICNNATAMSDFTFFGYNLLDINDTKLLDQQILNSIQGKSESNLNLLKNEINSRYNWNVIANNFHKTIKATF